MKNFYLLGFALLLTSTSYACYNEDDCEAISGGVGSYVCCNPGPYGYCVFNPSPSACRDDAGDFWSYLTEKSEETEASNE